MYHSVWFYLRLCTWKPWLLHQLRGKNTLHRLVLCSKLKCCPPCITRIGAKLLGCLNLASLTRQYGMLFLCLLCLLGRKCPCLTLFLLFPLPTYERHTSSVCNFFANSPQQVHKSTKALTSFTAPFSSPICASINAALLAEKMAPDNGSMDNVHTKAR